MVEVFKAESILQREALVAFLRENGIEPLTPPKDVTRKIADTTVDLAYGGYSAVSEGLPIYVLEEEKEQAQALITDFLTQISKNEVASAKVKEINHWNRFYHCSLFTMVLPGLMHLLALYHVFCAIRSGAPVQLVRLVSALFVFVATAFLVFSYLV